VKEQLEKLVLQMYRSGIQYAEAVRQFQSVFIITVLREQRANQVRAAQKLGMHRNTLRRIIRNFELDIRPLRPSSRRPPLSERAVPVQTKASPCLRILLVLVFINPIKSAKSSSFAMCIGAHVEMF